MGYQEAIEAAGAKIKTFKTFGDYQGTWMALTEDGKIISGAYGSCSGCDALQAEFDWDSEETPGYQEHLKIFGQSYINSAETLDETIKRYEIKITDEYAWEEDKEILKWLKQQKENL